MIIAGTNRWKTTEDDVNDLWVITITNRVVSKNKAEDRKSNKKEKGHTDGTLGVIGRGEIF